VVFWGVFLLLGALDGLVGFGLFGFGVGFGLSGGCGGGFFFGYVGLFSLLLFGLMWVLVFL
jgi:hypothetical protein